MKTVDEIISRNLPELEPRIRVLIKQVIDTTYEIGYADGIKKAIQIRCDHKDTENIGDEDNIQTVCTICEEVF